MKFSKKPDNWDSLLAESNIGRIKSNKAEYPRHTDQQGNKENETVRRQVAHKTGLACIEGEYALPYDPGM